MVCRRSTTQLIVLLLLHLCCSYNKQTTTTTTMIRTCIHAFQYHHYYHHLQYRISNIRSSSSSSSHIMKHRKQLYYRNDIMFIHQQRSALLRIRQQQQQQRLLFQLFSTTPTSVTEQQQHQKREWEMEQPTTTIGNNITILDQNEYYLVIAKPPSIVCHYSSWTGLHQRSHQSIKKKKNITKMKKQYNNNTQQLTVNTNYTTDHMPIDTTSWTVQSQYQCSSSNYKNCNNEDVNDLYDNSNNNEIQHEGIEPSNNDIVQQQEVEEEVEKQNNDNKNIEIPILQRIRQQIGRRVNLVHRLDRGTSGCLLLTYADNDNDNNNDNPLPINSTRATAILSEALADKVHCTKTYIALVRGEGILYGEDLKDRDWFCIDRSIKNENGIERNAITKFKFIAGQHNGGGTILDRPRASIVLAQPYSGRWHQIRKHLNGLSHPIIGDSTHGNSKINRLWKDQYDLPPQRTCLHLLNLVIGPTEVCPNGINVTCPIPFDMMNILQKHLPSVLSTARPILEKEGFIL